MTEKTASFRDRSATVMSCAAFSSQHAELILTLFDLAGLSHASKVREEMILAEQSFREIKNNAGILHQKRLDAELEGPSSTDMVLLRNIIASFSHISLDFIDSISDLLKNESYLKLHMFLKHIAAEQKSFLEQCYPLSF